MSSRMMPVIINLLPSNSDRWPTVFPYISYMYMVDFWAKISVRADFLKFFHGQSLLPFTDTRELILWSSPKIIYVSMQICRRQYVEQAPRRLKHKKSRTWVRWPKGNIHPSIIKLHVRLCSLHVAGHVVHISSTPMRGYLLGTTVILFFIMTAITVLQRGHLILIVPCVSVLMSKSLWLQQGHLIAIVLSPSSIRLHRPSS